MTTGRINQVASPEAVAAPRPGRAGRAGGPLSLSVLPSVPRLWRRVPRTRGAVGVGPEPSRPPASRRRRRRARLLRPSPAAGASPRPFSLRTRSPGHRPAPAAIASGLPATDRSADRPSATALATADRRRVPPTPSGVRGDPSGRFALSPGALALHRHPLIYTQERDSGVLDASTSKNFASSTPSPFPRGRRGQGPAGLPDRPRRRPRVGGDRLRGGLPPPALGGAAGAASARTALSGLQVPRLWMDCKCRVSEWTASAASLDGLQVPRLWADCRCRVSEWTAGAASLCGLQVPRRWADCRCRASGRTGSAAEQEGPRWEAYVRGARPCQAYVDWGWPL